MLIKSMEAILLKHAPLLQQMFARCTHLHTVSYWHGAPKTAPVADAVLRLENDASCATGIRLFRAFLHQLPNRISLISLRMKRHLLTYDCVSDWRGFWRATFAWHGTKRKCFMNGANIALNFWHITFRGSISVGYISIKMMSHHGQRAFLRHFITLGRCTRHLTECQDKKQW